MKKILSLTTLLLLIITFSFAQSGKKNQVTLSKVTVIDYPTVEWINYPKDSTAVAQNTQVMSAVIKSRLPIKRVEVKLNNITMSVYEGADFDKTMVGENRYEKHIEPSLSMRNGFNTIHVIATNDKEFKKEEARRVIVDPNLITVLRSEKDHNAPMIYVSDPGNIRDDHTTVYQESVSLKGTVIDESGIQHLKVNGLVVPVKENGAYSLYMPLNVGENPVVIEAKDINQNISLKKFTIDRKNADGTEYNFSEAKNYLLIVGINKYEHWPQLNNAVSDVTMVKDVLTSKYRFDQENIVTLTNEQATRSGILTALRGFIERVTPRDNFMIYYSGHGFFDKLLNEGYWVPIEAESNDIGAYIPNAQILKIIENINSQHTFLVADACFSGSLFASSSRGYSDHVEKLKSRWGFASGRLELVSDGSVGQNSPFAMGFYEFLNTNKEQKVPVSDLIQYVKKKVAETTEQAPIGNPLKGVGDDGGEFVFYKRTK
jgi:Caspase domain/Glucodextranase, domain B